MGYLKPVACVRFFASLFALLALAATADAGRRTLAGAVGGLAGVWFGSDAGSLRPPAAPFPPGPPF